MSNSNPSQFSILLNEVARGSEEAKAELILLVYQDLRRIAQSCLKQERNWPSLQATALVHEVYLRLFGENQVELHNRQHFMIVAARQMRRILIDHARAAKAVKRNGGEGFVPLEERTLLTFTSNPDPSELNELLQDLERLYPRAGEIVNLRFFVGLTEGEVAKVLDISETTVKREWKFARAWLYDQMRGSDENGQGTV